MRPKSITVFVSPEFHERISEAIHRAEIMEALPRKYRNSNGRVTIPSLIDHLLESWVESTLKRFVKKGEEPQT